MLSYTCTGPVLWLMYDFLPPAAVAIWKRRVCGLFAAGEQPADSSLEKERIIGKATVFLKAMNKPLPENFQEYIG